MNANFEAALKLINMKSYKDAETSLRAAIEEERKNKHEDTAIEYTCVLGELLADIGQPEQARTEFTKVYEYCKKTKSLPKQQEIAMSFLNIHSINGVIIPEAPSLSGKPAKSAQNKAFINKQTRTRGKK